MPHFPRVLSCCLALVLGSVAQATPPTGFTESVFVQNNALNNATGLAWAPDGSNRLFVIRKDGAVRVVQNGTVLATPFATLSPVYTNSECGLIGFCFDPDFLTNRYVYFFVTVSASEQQIIRYRDSGGVGTDRTILVADLPTAGQNHDGGSIGIGPDGHLYWAIGDLGNGTGVNNNLTSLAAKVGRANRFTGLPLDDNPFHDGAGPNNDYIWALGFRNPFTLTFQPRTGDLWMNVVGTSYEQVFVVQKGDHAGYSNFENNQPTGFLEPKISYRTNSSDTRSITAGGLARVGGVTTVTTTGNHGFRPGQQVTISGATDASFNDTFFIASRPSLTTFTVSQAALPDASSGGGSAQSAEIGGCITGGTFYDSTLFPAEYRGNFFFGDYNSSVIARGRLDSGNNLLSTELFVTGSASQVDMATGPDGALYYIGVSGGTVRKLVPTTVEQGLIVQPTAIPVPAGGRALFTVRLAEAPASEVTVTISKQGGGDADLTSEDATLIFNPSNWNQVQTVTLAGAVDDDEDRGTATFIVHASGLTDVSVTATEIATQPVTAPTSSLVYRVGDDVPGETGGQTFASFGLPVIDGEIIAFDAVMKQGASRIPILVGGAPMRVLWRKGDTAPGLGTPFTTLLDPVFNGGHLAFYGTAANGPGATTATNQGLWSDVAGALRLIARKGSVAPGTGGAKFFSFTAHNLPKTGGLIFQAKLTSGVGPTAKVTTRTDVGLWREGAVEPELLLREGTFLTIAQDDDREVKTFQVFPIVTGSADQRRAVLPNGTVLAWVTFYDNSQALLKFAPAPPTEILALTTEAPVSPANTTLKTLASAAGHAGGQLFRGVLAGTTIKSANDTALLSISGAGVLDTPVQEGVPLASLNGAQFSLLDPPAFAGGELLFTGTLKTGIGGITTRSDRGLFLQDGSAVERLAVEGQAVGSKVFEKVLHFAATTEATDPSVVAFLTQLRLKEGGVTSRNDTAICIRDDLGGVHIAQSEGDMIELSDTLSVPITVLNAFQASVRTPGQGRAVSPDGKVVYRVTLGKYGQAIIFAQLPEAR